MREGSSAKTSRQGEGGGEGWHHSLQCGCTSARLVTAPVRLQFLGRKGGEGPRGVCAGRGGVIKSQLAVRLNIRPTDDRFNVPMRLRRRDVDVVVEGARVDGRQRQEVDVGHVEEHRADLGHAASENDELGQRGQVRMTFLRQEEDVGHVGEHEAISITRCERKTASWSDGPVRVGTAFSFGPPHNLHHQACCLYCAGMRELIACFASSHLRHYQGKLFDWQEDVHQALLASRTMYTGKYSSAP